MEINKAKEKCDFNQPIQDPNPNLDTRCCTGQQYLEKLKHSSGSCGQEGYVDVNKNPDTIQYNTIVYLPT